MFGGGRGAGGLRTRTTTLAKRGHIGSEANASTHIVTSTIIQSGYMHPHAIELP